MQHVFLEVQACLLTPPKLFLPGAELMGDGLCGSPRGPIPRESEAAAKAKFEAKQPPLCSGSH